MARFLYPTLDGLPRPQLIDEISSEALIAEIKSFILARWAEVRVARPDLPPLDMLGLESEPMTMLVEAFAFRETLLRALVNDKARAVLLAYARGSDLDHIGALVGVSRAVLVAASEGAAAVLESDDRLRRRIQLAPEAFSVAGPAGAYEFHALTLDPSILDAYAWSPSPGVVHVAVVGQGVVPVDDAIITRLVRRFGRDDLVPITDSVVVRRAEIVPFDLAVTVYAGMASDEATIRTSVAAAVAAYVGSRARIGLPVYLSGLIAAAKGAGVDNVVVSSPAGDVTVAPHQIARLAGLSVSVVVSG